MGVFSRLVLFSEVHGTVLKDGRPVEGAELIQKVVWSDNEKKNPTQQTVTDKSGAFRFPTIERGAGLLRLIPAQPVMSQTIVIRYQGVEYMAWRHSKFSYDPNDELDGRPLKLVCELTRQPDAEGTHYGICKAG
ncbi:carboxypeptidase-like regulatory domain-containing protein [Trinickia fusca]|uniref:Carboxypeptidase regulatory-like domain-containing protein n=1 Tax=Trinickia fusca TaxID=2419777 RepID=A0A494XQG6_9BURK|nr:carboxypeptidase-like regulatory domain-containing protein [Trinickia fusca]RKP52880.1 carboxypeptidase regulatory-like domain-containing protein [Trinickia fusca]